MTLVTSCCGSLITYTTGSRIIYYFVSYDTIVMKINSNPIRFVLKANKNSRIVSTCCQVAVTDLGTAKRRGNNQARSLEVSPLSPNPCEMSCTAPEEMNNHSTRFQHVRRGRVSRSHTSSLPVYYMSNPGHSKNRKGGKKNVKKRDQQFRGGHALLDRGEVEFVIVVRLRGQETPGALLGQIVYFCRWSEADRHLKGLCTYPNSPL